MINHNPNPNMPTASNDPSHPRDSAIERWRRELSEITGCSPAEIADRLHVLMQFCATLQISPEKLIDECSHGPNRMARRAFYLRAACGTEANLVVQSYLIHNGVNVFGDLVCLPITPEAVRREQGEG